MFAEVTIMIIKNKKYYEISTIYRGKEGQPQQFLIQATFSSFSRPSQLEILALRLLCGFKFLILEDKSILKIRLR